MAAASLCIATVFIAVSLIGYTVTVDAVSTYTGLVHRICNGNIYPFGSNYFDAPGSITRGIVLQVPDNPNFDVYWGPDSGYYLYGHGSCSGGLNRVQCSICMHSARDQLFSVCSWQSVGAQIELQGCKLRYEEYNFGQP